MSNIDSGAKLLNFIVVGAVAAAAMLYIISPRTPVAPPDDAWFKSAVINRSEPVLVKFGAEWCGPCRMLDPELDKLQHRLHGQVEVVRVNVDNHPDLAEHYGVSSIPRLLLFNHGQVVADRVGYVDGHQLQAWVASNCRN